VAVIVVLVAIDSHSQ